MDVKNTFNKRFKRGSYSSVLTLIVIVAVVVANYLVAEIPTKYTELDVSGRELYVISDETKELLGGIKEEVTIYLVAQSGGEDSIIEELLERYQELSRHIKVIYQDPVENPSFTMKYSENTVYENSLIVESGKRFKIVSIYDIYKNSYVGTDENGEAQYTTDFEGEGQLTSAIKYVLTDKLPTLYALTGHEEMEIPDALATSIEQENIAVEDLNLIVQNKIPEDCDGIIALWPQRDFTEDELSLLMDYMEQGGKMLLITGYAYEESADQTAYNEKEMPNLKKLTSAYGLTTKQGVVLEGDAGHYVQYNHYVVPEYRNHVITKPLENSKINCLVPLAQALEEVETSENVEISYLLQTSEFAYRKANPFSSETMEKAEEDETGIFQLGAAVRKGDSALVYFTTAYLVDEETNILIAGGNYDLLINAAGWLCDHEEAITIRGKNMDSGYVTMTSRQSMVWSILMVGALPVLLIISGIVIWIVRRRR